MKRDDTLHQIAVYATQNKEGVYARVTVWNESMRHYVAVATAMALHGDGGDHDKTVAIDSKTLLFWVYAHTNQQISRQTLNYSLFPFLRKQTQVTSHLGVVFYWVGELSRNNVNTILEARKAMR